MFQFKRNRRDHVCLLYTRVYIVHWCNTSLHDATLASKHKGCAVPAALRSAEQLHQFWYNRLLFRNPLFWRKRCYCKYSIPQSSYVAHWKKKKATNQKNTTYTS